MPKSRRFGQRRSLGRAAAAGGGRGAAVLLRFPQGGAVAGHTGGILFFSSPIGLGNASRDAAIAAALGGAAGGAVRFVSGGAAAAFLSDHGFDAVDAYRPPRLAAGGGSLRRPSMWLASYYLYYKRCLRASRALIAQCRPDVVVSDEDFAALSAAHEAGVRTVLVTDVFETRFCRRWPGSRIESLMNGAMRGIMRQCGAVVAPFRPGSEEAAAAQRAFSRAAAAGPMARRPGAGREELRARLGMTSPTVLACAGGTDAGRAVLDAAERAVLEGGRADVIVASGPSLPPAGRDARAGRARHVGAVPNLHEYVYAADAVVSLAGRSTMDECSEYGTPGVFIPIRGHFEQEDNAAAAGFAHSDAGRLGELIGAALDRGRMPQAEWVGRGGHSPGASRAAEAIVSAAGAGGGGPMRRGSHDL